MLTVKQVAQTLSVSPKTIYGWASTGYLPAYKLGDALRFKEEDLERWLSNCKTQPIDTDAMAGAIVRPPYKPDVDAILDRAIAEENRMLYPSSGNGKTDQPKSHKRKKGGYYGSN